MGPSVRQAFLARSALLWSRTDLQMAWLGRGTNKMVGRSWAITRIRKVYELWRDLETVLGFLLLNHTVLDSK
jgi:hypothetical protein